jgi:CRISPR-associated endoribonuclease Cas6
VRKVRLRCSFSIDKIPLGYHMMFVSLIKTAIINSNSNYFEKIFQYKDKKNKTSKNYAWSLYLKDYELKKDEFLINGCIEFCVSTPDYEFFLNLYNGLVDMKQFEYKNFILDKVKVSMIREKEIIKNEVCFLTLSPIFIQDKNKKPLTYEDESFINELNYITDLNLRNYRGYGLNGMLKFIPIDMKKRIVKQEITDFKKSTGKKYHFVNAWAGQFILEGDYRDLKHIYNLGLGFKRGQGFGMVEVV